jgi:IS30 family transposase
MPEGYLHLTCEQRCQIMRSCKAVTRKPTSRGRLAWIRRRSAARLFVTSERAAIASSKRTRRPRRDARRPRTKNDAGLGGADRGETDARAVSPDQISGRLAKDGVAFISHERIYQHVWKDKKDGGALHVHLRHSGKKYNKRKGKKITTASKVRIPRGTSEPVMSSLAWNNTQFIKI